MAFNFKLPFFYKSVNPNIPQVAQAAEKLYQWDGSTNKPQEIINSKSAMPPLEITGQYAIWSDTFTLGYTNEDSASPIYFSDGGQGDDKILKMINAVAYRLGQSRFNDVNVAKAWALTEDRIYVLDDSTNAPTVCDPNITNSYSGGSASGGLVEGYTINRIGRAIYRFGGPSMNGGVEFDTQNLTVTKACIIEQLQDAYTGEFGVSSTGWSDTTTSPASYHAYTSNMGWNAIPQVGDVIYRDNTGSTYFGQGGFMYQDTSFSTSNNGNAFIWVTVGANGVVTSVEPLGYLTESE